MKIVLNGDEHTTSFKQALAEVAQGAETLSLAVSYLQVGGWELFRQHTPEINLPKMRIVCTDQMGITPPAAVKRVHESGAQIRNYNGSATYHPKVYLAHDKSGKPTRFLLGSANLSSSAFTKSVEAGVISADGAGLNTLNSWFNDLFSNRSAEFTPETLQEMEAKWKVAASYRARTRMRVRRGVIIPVPEAVSVESEDIDALEDVFATLKPPIGLLNMDYAGNNIRNVERVREVLNDWDTVITDSAPAHGKHRNELKLLGFAQGKVLTDLGIKARAANNIEEIAILWAQWLQRTPDSDLTEINSKLPITKRVFRQFWRLKDEVRDYFLNHAERPSDAVRPTLQVIELLCNASDVVQDFTLEDIETLVPLIRRPEAIPEFIRDDVHGYLVNKGTRSWDTPDRRILPLAWRAAAI